MNEPDSVVDVVIEPEGLKARLGVPPHPRGVVIFAHGSGSGRLSPRNNMVAAGLRESGLATLLLDLLTIDEEEDRANVFDIPLLAERLVRASQWAAARPELQGLPQGYFGASTGGGAALLAASRQGDAIAAVVSRGGRPDLAGPTALARLQSPTMLIVGSLDTEVIELNRMAMRHMNAPHELVIVPGAGHLFEEGRTLDEVVIHAVSWFTRHF
jgi:putative phosphoribosyl transferase